MDDRSTNGTARFSGQVALVVGGAQGIGKAIAVRLGRERAHVIIADIDRPMMEAAVREMCAEGSDARLVPFDVRESAQVKAMVQQVLAWYGRIDVLMYAGGRPESRGGAVSPGLGARQIWMPTRSARNHRAYHSQPGGISILDEQGKLLTAVQEILEAMARSDAILGTGHLSPEETSVLIDAASSRGVSKILVTHPEWGPTYYSCAAQKDLAQRGNIFFERCFVSTTHLCGHVPFETIERAIIEIGVDHTILSTDLGQPETPPPVEGLRLYAERLRSTGFSVDQIRCMMQANPERLLAHSLETKPLCQPF